MKSDFQEFTNLYPVQKTLRFALKPIGETEKSINSKGLLEKDEDIAEKYSYAKKIIDEYHRDFIRKSLSSFEFITEDLEEYKALYFLFKKDRYNKTVEKKLSAKQNQLRKLLSVALKNQDLFKKELIKTVLPAWLNENLIQLEGISNPKRIIEEFKDWTVYFKGFHENRKNIYTDKEISTSIGFRLIHENLPRFIDNIERYQKIKALGIDLSSVQKTFGVDLDTFFSLENFNTCLTQKGIDLYNLVKGGFTKNDRQKEQGINEIINLHVQSLTSELKSADDTEKQELKKKIKQVRSCTLEELYKQILSDRSSISFREDVIEYDGDLSQQILGLFTIDPETSALIAKDVSVDFETGEVFEITFNFSEELLFVLNTLKEADPAQVFIKNDNELNQISTQIFGNWSVIKNSLEYYAEHEHLGLNNKGLPKKLSQKEKDKWLKQKYFSFETVHQALELFFRQYSDADLSNQEDENGLEKGFSKEMKQKALSKPLYSYFLNLKAKIPSSRNQVLKEVQLIENILSTHGLAQAVLLKYSSEKGQQLRTNLEEVLKIKAYLDGLNKLQQFLKPLNPSLSKKDKKQSIGLNKDSTFYGRFEILCRVLGQIISLYNQTRNYLTQKPYTTEKYKLNFENSTLADGWDESKEKDNTAIIFLREGKYYLGIMDYKHKYLFSPPPEAESDDVYQKIVYKLLPTPSKMLPKVFFSKKNIAYYASSSNIRNIRNHGSHTKNGKPQKGFQKVDFSLDHCHEIIDFYKDSILIHPKWKNFGFKFSKTSNYANINEFYREVEHQGYEITSVPIDKKYIDENVKSGKLYLFEIYSKDFSPKSKGKPNLQTLYWKALFDPINLKNVVYKLNGKAELFFRKASIKYSDKVWKKGHHADSPNKKQNYPIIKDRRYAQNTYLFHASISCNFKASEVTKFNDIVNTYLKGRKDVTILGIDRGERHLAYYTLINQNGEILKQGSFNNPLGNRDYHQLLDHREKERDKARKSWGAIQKINDLKIGYISQVVHEIVRMVMEHNAIVVFENLNFGFKRGRFKVEKQVYQNLEKMLIQKLNYLVLKDLEPNAPGGWMNALQLTSPFSSFKDTGEQTGIIYYVPAYYTSRVCPATGFVNLLYPRYETVQKAQHFFGRFDSIRYLSEEDSFAFEFTYKNFTPKAEGSRQNWIIYTHGSRLENFRDPSSNNQWNTHEVHLTSELKRLFEEYSIDYQHGADLHKTIATQKSSPFFKHLIRLLKLTLKLRNSRINSEEDWMISPVKDSNGQFFDSRKSLGSVMPQNADANGAFHIGLKGLWILGQIKQWKPGKRLNLAISNKAWFKFIQEKPYQSN